MGDLDADDTNCRVIAKGAGVILVSVDYRLAPQHKFPAGLDDCVAGFEWAIENAKSLGGVPGKAFIAGISAGGGSAFGLALRLVDNGKANQLAGIVAQVPVTIHPDVIPEKLKRKYTSYDQNAENTINSNSAMHGFWGK
jgi:versiconal hemiacetal acetate esterase